MDYTTRLDEAEGISHVNYQCPCGCSAGLLYDRSEGPMHMGKCCCGRLLWLGQDAEAQVRASFVAEAEYDLIFDSVVLPWGDAALACLAVPKAQLVKEAKVAQAQASRTRVIDPVCRMSIDPALAAGTSVFNGATYHFCAAVCKTRFDAEPSRFVKV